MKLSIRAMHYFVTAVDERSIVRAARSLNVVPSAVSVAIDAVEAEFGLKLIQRFPAKGIQPTASGFTVANRVRRLIEEYDDLITSCTELRDSLSGQLTVGYYAPLAPAFLPTIFAPLLKEHPDVRIHYVECNNESVQQGLLDGLYDLILFVSDGMQMGIQCDVLIDAPPYLLLPSNHPLAKRKSIAFEEINDIDLVLLDLPFTTQYLRGLIDGYGIHPNIVATATSTEMVRSLVASGLGGSILNMRPLTQQTQSGRAVVEIPINPPLQPLRLVVGKLEGNSRRLVKACSERLIDFFDTEASQKLVTKVAMIAKD